MGRGGEGGRERGFFSATLDVEREELEVERMEMTRSGGEK